MQQLGWSRLEQHRTQARAIMMYRVVHGQVATPASAAEHETTQQQILHSSCVFQLGLLMPSDTHSFFPATIRIWNNLPSVVSMSPSIEVFKSRLAGVTFDTEHRLDPSCFYQHFCTFLLVLFIEFSSCFHHFMQICHVRHYSQENLYIMKSCIRMSFTH